MKNYILIGLVSVLVFFSIGASIKCANLEKENLKLKQEHLIVVDSIKIENQILEEEIEDLFVQLDTYQQKIDSLNQIKQKVIIRYKTEHIISENITDGVQMLKDNIKCEKYY